MSNYEIAELTWENGQLGMNGLSGLVQTKPTIWEGGCRTSETLESIVHQATWQNSSGEKWAETPSGDHQQAVKKRTRSELDGGTLSVNGSNCMEVMSSRESHEINSMNWANSFDSPPPSFKHKTTFDDSTSHGGSENQDEDGETKTETLRSGSGTGSSRKSRVAAVHNQSERRRRDRINQKMKALQKLVPNASKTDKASMLDEVIEYLKQLQAQVQLMSSASARNMPHMMMSLGMQHQLHMSLLARMGMPTNTTTPFLPPPFLLPSSVLQPHALPPPPPPLPQATNMEIYKKMAEAYLQQLSQSAQGTSNQ